MNRIDLAYYQPSKRSRLNRQGSNQYRTRRRKNSVFQQFERYEGYPRFIKVKTWISILAILLIMAILETVVWAFKAQAMTTQMWQESIAMSAMPPKPAKKFIEQPTSEQEQIEKYITETFGADAPQAFKLLTCENGTLRADRVNTAGNTPAGSRDIGVFQINEYWQGVNAKFLFNWKVNIDMAKQLFDENHGSFKLWSCARKVGLE